MAELKIRQFAGLYPSVSPIHAPQGALLRANNCVIRDGRLEPRRGFGQADVAFGSSQYECRNILFFGRDRSGSSSYISTLVVADNTSVGGDSGLSLYSDRGTSGFAYTQITLKDVSPNVGTSGGAAPAYPYTGVIGGGKISTHAAEAQNSFYWTSTKGIHVLDSTTSSVAQRAGVPRALGSYSIAANTTASSGYAAPFLASGSSVAYRFVWGYKDANGRYIYGAPSGREVVTASSTCNWDIRVIIPPGLTTSHFCRIYRTESTTTGIPSEEYYLVSEVTGLTSTDLNTNRYTPTYTDFTPDSALGAVALYTNARQGDGSLAANDPPPLAADIAYWGNQMFYANTAQSQTLSLDLVAVDGTNTSVGASSLGSALRSGDTVTIDGVLYTASNSAENIATRTFKITGSSGGGTVSADLAATARSLVRVINGNASTLIAYYVGTDTSDFGKIVLQRTTPDLAAFSVTSPARGASWSPALPTSGTSVQSTAEIGLNRLYYSKLRQPEAVPALNYIEIGSGARRILRVFVARERLFVFKEDGIFVVSPGSPFRVDQVDPSAVLVSPQSLAVLGNRIFGLLQNGVCAITEGGIEEVSAPAVANQFTSVVTAPINQALEELAFGAAHQVDGLYIISVPGLGIYVYSPKYRCWTTWSFMGITPTAAAFRAGTGQLYLGATGYLRPENRSFSNSDCCDGYKNGLFLVSNVVDISGTSRNLTVNGVGINTFLRVGDAVVVQTSAPNPIQSCTGLVSSIASDGSSAVISVPLSASFSSNGLAAYRNIASSFDLMPQDCSEPGVLKQYKFVTYHFGANSFLSTTARFCSGFDSSTTTGTSLAFSAGVIPEAGSILASALPQPANKRVGVPSLYQRASTLTVGFSIDTALSYWSIDGITVEFDATSERNSR